MSEFSSIIDLNEFLYKENIELEKCKFINYVGHKKQQLIYGSLFSIGDILLFQQHRWTEVNYGKPIPKKGRVCGEMKYKHKLVTVDIYESFKVLSEDEYYNRDKYDWLNTPMEAGWTRKGF